MDRDEKITFMSELCAAVLHAAVAKVDQMPEDWNGIELRDYLADKFDESRWQVHNKKRRKAYRNEVITRNL